MVTPFDEAGDLDLDASAALARWLVDHGSDGLVVAGTTGEGPVLSDREKLDLWRAVAEAVTVPVIANTGTNDTRHSVALTAQAKGTGVDAVLVVTPYYNRPSQEGLFDHFRAVAGATDLPVLLYDIPVRSGRRIATDHHAAPGRGGQERGGGEGRRRGTRPPRPSWPPGRRPPSRSTAATTPSPCPCSRWGRSGW